MIPLSNRAMFGCLALMTTLAMAFALYLQYILELSVCPLCYTQRVFVIGTGIVAGIAALHGPQALGQRIYALLAGLLALTGAGVAGRHVWLQSLPEDLAPACGPSLEYMLSTLPFSDALEVLLMGDGNCAEVVWTLLGFSIPQMTFMVFTTLVAMLGFVFLRAK